MEAFESITANEIKVRLTTTVEKFTDEMLTIIGRCIPKVDNPTDEELAEFISLWDVYDDLGELIEELDLDIQSPITIDKVVQLLDANRYISFRTSDNKVLLFWAEQVNHF